MNHKQKLLQLHLYFHCLFSKHIIFGMGTLLNWNNPQTVRKKSILKALQITSLSLISLHTFCMTLGK